MIRKTETFDVVVCGGGMAGFSGAVAAARHGAKTCLIQDRPVLGGNASSEVRVTIHGAAAFHAYARETGIISEVLIEERAQNHEEVNENGWTNSVFDQVLYDIAMRTPNLTLHLNTSVCDVLLGDDHVSGLSQIPDRPLPDTSHGWYHRPACATRSKIGAIVAHVSNSETELIIHGRTFVDCTGDGLIADLAGCEWRMGTESREQTGEIYAMPKASTDTMGNSIHIRARDIGRPAPYTPPPWIKTIPDADFFHRNGRTLCDMRGGFWWIEIGMPWHTIHENETTRKELTEWALAIWDWMKNKDESTKSLAANFALEWIGQVTGKRESRRIIGQLLLTEPDVMNTKKHDDEIAFGGWFLDLHAAGGLLAKNSMPEMLHGESTEHHPRSYVGPYGIPLRCLIAKDVDNLMMAGRNISATHVALGTVRTMATTALMGQGVGTAAALGIAERLTVAQLPTRATEIQQRLLRDGCFLLNVSNADTRDLARAARASASSSMLSQGAGTSDVWARHGLARHIQATEQGWPLDKMAAQWIAVAGGQLDRVSFCLSNSSDHPEQVKCKLTRAEHIWDYRRELPAITQTTLMVLPGQDRWIDWPVNLTGLQPGYLRLELEANHVVMWRFSQAILPGQLSAWAISDELLHRMGHAVTMAFGVAPGQPVYGPEQVLTGVTRPHRATNLWRSDAGRPLPQWLQLTWNKPQKIGQVELTFAGNLLREYHAYPPFWRDPQSPRDYRIEAWLDGAWQEVHRESGNYQRHRRHRLSTPIISDKIRILVTATHGDHSAAIYELRAYSPGQ